MTNEDLNSEYQDSCHLSQPPSSSEQQQRPDDSAKESSKESELSTEPSTKSSASGQSISHNPRLGSRPVLDSAYENLVAVSKKGARIGESSPRAKYTDREISMVIELRSEGYFYSQIARMMDMPKSTCHAIVNGKMRAQVVDRWKKRSG